MNAGVAQTAEQNFRKVQVRGSTPRASSTTLYELWIFFVIALVTFSPGVFRITASTAEPTERLCQQKGQRDIELKHGEELLLITPCVKIPDREKA